MGWEALLASLVGSLAWPITVLVLVLVIWFSAPSDVRKDLLRRLRKAGPSGVELDAASKQVTEASQATAHGAVTLTGIAHASTHGVAGAQTAQEDPEETDTEALRSTQQLIDAAAKWGWVAAGGEPKQFPHPLVTWTSDGAKIIGSRVGLNAGDTVTFAPGSFIDPKTGKPDRRSHILWRSTDDLAVSAESTNSGAAEES